MSAKRRNHPHKAQGKTKLLPDVLNRRVAAYMLAAGAVGMTATAAANEPPAGTIVFTPMHVDLYKMGSTHFPIDVNQDGITDFYATLTNFLTIQSTQGFAAGGGRLMDRPANGNAAILRPLIPGAVIGSSAAFNSSAKLLAWGRFVAHSGHSGYSVRGPWANSGERYLGVRFQISSETHYGWVRMDVKATTEEVSAFITGYAYNTVANQSIKAGEGYQPPKQAGLYPPTLGILALGAAGLVLWRGREKES